MSTVFLPRKRKSLYAKLSIPLTLQPFFNGRAEVWRSLKTLDKAEARVRSDKRMAALVARKTVRRLLMDLVEGHLLELEKKGLLPKGEN